MELAVLEGSLSWCRTELADGDADAVWQGLLSPLGGEHHPQDQQEGAAELLQPVSVSPC